MMFIFLDFRLKMRLIPLSLSSFVTKCRDNFDRSWTLEKIRLHEVMCAVKKPKYQTMCRFCGSVSFLFLFVFSLSRK